jgi:uroporphyrinogen-III synthase
MMGRPLSIWLLRDAARQPDPYETVFRQAGFEVEHHPVLAFEPLNDTALLEAVGNARRYSGLVLTSPRAADRFLEAAREEAIGAWTDLPVYVVGERTGADIRDAGLRVWGEGTRTGTALAKYIRRRHASDLPLLFLAGDRRRPELVALLGAAEIGLEEVTVYATRPLTLDQPDVLPDWLAFFSPSGLEAVTHWPDLTNVRLAAIGETTARAMRALGLRASAVATEPTPGGLYRAIRKALYLLH